MKKSLLILTAFVFTTTAFATVHTITTEGNTYTPQLFAAVVGDTVNFEISAMHPTVQVTLATYLANGTDPDPNGFGLHTSSFSIVLTEEDVPGISYVCTNHVQSGMKGGFTISSTVAIDEEAPIVEFTYGPNPIVNSQLNYSINQSGIKTFNFFSVTGRLEKTIEVTTNEGVIDLDLIPGNYVLQIMNANREAIETVRLTVK